MDAESLTLPQSYDDISDIVAMHEIHCVDSFDFVNHVASGEGNALLAVHDAAVDGVPSAVLHCELIDSLLRSKGIDYRPDHADKHLWNRRCKINDYVLYNAECRKPPCSSSHMYIHAVFYGSLPQKYKETEPLAEIGAVAFYQ